MLDGTFDPIAVVVDRPDSCGARSLDDLSDLYDARGSFDCVCAGPSIRQGRENIARYWSLQLDKADPRAFKLTGPASVNSTDGPGRRARLDQAG